MVYTHCQRIVVFCHEILILDNAPVELNGQIFTDKIAERWADVVNVDEVVERFWYLAALDLRADFV